MKYKFYYDESNNVRTVYIKGYSYNIDKDPNQLPPANFVLGGVCHRENVEASNVEELKQMLDIQKTSPEIKLKHIAKGDFLDLLNSDKLSKVLTWVLESNYFIHFKALNFIYWSYVDIIDDIYCHFIDDKIRPRKVYDLLMTDHRVWLDNYKNNLYKLVMIDKEGFLRIIKEFEYPFVKKEDCRKFIRSINKYAKKYLVDKKLQEKFNLNNNDLDLIRELTYLMDGAKDIKNVDLTYMSEPDVLIDNLSFFYYNAIEHFNDSIHIFDKEYKVEGNLVSCGYQEKYNFQFVDSISYIEVQLSDVISGVLSKYFEFLSNNRLDYISHTKEHLNEQQRSNLLTLKSLFVKSDNENKELLFRVFPTESHNKHAFFMFDFMPKKIVI